MMGMSRVIGKNMSDAIRTKLGEGRRVAIPAELCHRYHFQPGDLLVLEPTERGIVLRRWDDVVREVQMFFADVAPPGVCLSDELSRGRRAEAAKESHD
jgi:bifunctional DNA-binding transcriptional regulator/antitoxin component of YhaV-PrlF toxin-antitoxin module